MNEQQLQARIDELQARNTELENERRMWKARNDAKQTLLVAMLEAAEAADIEQNNRDVFDAVDSSVFKRIHEVMVRNDHLEVDAWTMTTQLAKTFLKRAKNLYSSMPDDEWKADAAVFIGDFIEQFTDLFKEQ